MITQEASLGKPVALGEIEVELKRLWEADKASTRASLINFAVYSEREDALAEDTAIISEIVETNACRALLIGSSRVQDELAARAWITAHCHLSNGRKSVCSEQITFQIEGSTCDSIRNIVFAHLDSDLPLVFWWRGELSPIFEPRLYSSIDRLIVDSGAWSEPLPSFERIVSAIENTPQKLVVHDLNWTRALKVRLALAGIFDDPVALEEIGRIEEVKIVCGPSRLSGLQLAAWLATQLNWTWAAQKETPHRLLFQSAERQIAVEILSAKDDEDSSISEVTLKSNSGVFRVAKPDPCTFFHSYVEMPQHRTEMITPIGPQTTATLVSDVLARGGNNTLFQKSLPVFLRLLRAV